MTTKKKAVSTDQITGWVHRNFDGDYKISFNADGEIVIEGSIMLNNHELKGLPYKFASVSGNFSIGGYRPQDKIISQPTYAIETLKGCPDTVGGIFNCAFCHKLKSLEYGPRKAGRYFCNNCDLTSLQHIAMEITEGEVKAYGNNDLIDIAVLEAVKGLAAADLDFCSDFMYGSDSYKRLCNENKIYGYRYSDGPSVASF